MAERWVLLLPKLAAEGNKPVEEGPKLAESQCQNPCFSEFWLIWF